jgi:hypothetical protein
MPFHVDDALFMTHDSLIRGGGAAEREKRVNNNMIHSVRCVVWPVRARRRPRARRSQPPFSAVRNNGIMLARPDAVLAPMLGPRPADADCDVL